MQFLLSTLLILIFPTVAIAMDSSFISSMQIATYLHQYPSCPNNNTEYDKIFWLPVKENEQPPQNVTVTRILPKDITLEQLNSLLTKKKSGTTGRVTSLVVRPHKCCRKLVPALKATSKKIEGDYHTFTAWSAKDQPELDVATFMDKRDSDILGGAHISGDNIHADISIEDMKPGDLLVFNSSDDTEKPAILSLSYMSHNACPRLRARSNKLAVDFFNEHSNIHLRGLRLFVVREGIIKVGDMVTHLVLSQFPSIMHARCNLTKDEAKRHIDLLEQSKNIMKEKEIKQQEAKKNNNA